MLTQNFGITLPRIDGKSTKALHHQYSCHAHRKAPKIVTHSLANSKSTKLIHLFSITLPVIVLIAQPSSAQTIHNDSAIAITNVNVLTMVSDQVLENQTVIIRSGAIESLGASSEIEIPKNALTIEGNGRYLMPGLSDLHVHIRRSDEYINYLAWGVTTIMHLGGSESRGRSILADKQKIANGEITGPNIYTTERILDGDPPTSRGHYKLATEQEAREKVAEMKDAGVDFVKTYNSVSLPVFRAIVDEAKKHNLRVLGHIPRNFDPFKAFDAGLSAVAHTEEFFFTVFKGPRKTKDMDKTYRPDHSKIPAVIDALIENEIAVMPCLGFTFTNLLMWDELDLMWNDPEVNFQHPNTIADWSRENINRRKEIENFIFRGQLKYELMQELTRKFEEAGILQVIGTDASLPGLSPGKAAHRELTELVKAGLSNYQALSIGTRNAGIFAKKYIDPNSRFGIIAPGYRADLILLEDNPLEDVRNARKISAVAIAGNWVEKSQFDSKRAELASRFQTLNDVSAELDIALEKDSDEAEAIAKQILVKHAGNEELVRSIESRLNNAGYGAASSNNLDRAHKILELATKLFPESANVWDSFAEITLMMGDKEEAIKLYKQALKADPNFSSAKAQLKKLQQE